MAISLSNMPANIPQNTAVIGSAGAQQQLPKEIKLSSASYFDPKQSAQRVSGFKTNMTAYLARFGLQRLPEAFVILGLNGEEVSMKDLPQKMASDPTFADALINALDDATHNEAYIGRAINVLNGTIKEQLTIDVRKNTSKKASRETQYSLQRPAQDPSTAEAASKPPIILAYAGNINMNRSLADLTGKKTTGVATSTNEAAGKGKIDMSLSAAAFLLGSTRSEKTGTSFINYPEVKGALG